MNCENCGQREATVHLVDLVDGQRTIRWLCTVCAGQSSDEGEDDPLFGDGNHSAGSDNSGDPYSLASFLGEMFTPEDGTGPADPALCPRCGYSFAEFRGTNRLGCPGCYDAFGTQLLSILSHLHRHVSHLGKIPVSRRGGPTRNAALQRARIALEKAIGAEDFEKAARLRDRIQHLEAALDSEGGPPE